MCFYPYIYQNVNHVIICNSGQNKPFGICHLPYSFWREAFPYCIDFIHSTDLDCRGQWLQALCQVLRNPWSSWSVSSCSHWTYILEAESKEISKKHRQRWVVGGKRKGYRDECYRWSVACAPQGVREALPRWDLHSQNWPGKMGVGRRLWSRSKSPAWEEGQSQSYITSYTTWGKSPILKMRFLPCKVGMKRSSSNGHTPVSNENIL